MQVKTCLGVLKGAMRKNLAELDFLFLASGRFVWLPQLPPDVLAVLGAGW